MNSLRKRKGREKEQGKIKREKTIFVFYFIILYFAILCYIKRVKYHIILNIYIKKIGIYVIYIYIV